MRWIKIYALGLLLVLLAGCGGGFSELPASRPAGTVNGYVIDGPISGAQVTIYEFAEGHKGRALGSATTASDGTFSINLHTRDQPIYIEAQGGSYVEEASAKTVSLNPTERLTALMHYQSGKSMNVVITTYSHLATGLAEYNIGQEVDVTTALISATQSISEMIGLNVASVVPYSITRLSNTLISPQFSDNYAYGFMLAAISSWTAWASKQSGTPVHETLTSIALAQLMYRDIAADGLLDGFGYDESGAGVVELRAGAMKLGPDVYQKGFGQQMLNVANSSFNKTGFGVKDVRERANYLIQSPALNSPNSPTGDDKIGPAINRVVAKKLYENGVFDFSVYVDDPAGINLIAFEIDNTPLGRAADLLAPSITIDTKKYSDGVHTIGVIAEDSVGNRSIASFDVTFANASPFILVTSPRVTNAEAFTLKGIFVANGFDLAGLKIQNRIVNVEPNGAWQFDIILTSGVNDISITAFNLHGNQYGINQSVILDTVAPLIFVSYSSARFMVDEIIYNASLAAASEVGADLYVEDAEVSMEGITVTPAELTGRGVPFLEVAVVDVPKPELFNTEAPVVRIQYALNDVLLSEKEVHPSAYASLEGNYLIYLALDMLHADWKTAKRKDVHSLTIVARDQATNESRFGLKFKTRFRGKSDVDDLNPDFPLALYCGCTTH